MELTRDEIKKQLDDLGVEYNKRTRTDLLALKLKEVKAVEEITRPPKHFEEIVPEAEKTRDGHVTKSGIFIPLTASQESRHRSHNYTREITDSEYRISKNGQHVITYRLSVHGENWKEYGDRWMRKFADQ